MACYKPLVAIRKATGGVSVLRAKGYCELDQGEFLVSCGQCVGCRIDRSRQMAVRCVHEERMTREKGYESSFLTLTYDDQNMPEDGSLEPADHVEFVNKLRTRLWRKKPRRNFRYYMCGEYGDKLQRPHFHYLIFGYDFPDRYEFKEYRGVKYYRSEELEKVWTYGHSLIGHVTVESAAYCARYVMKKQTGQKAEGHYVNEDGVVLQPEFARMSLKPGIGAEWFSKYGISDVYDSGDFIVINGKKYSTPRYYDKLLEKLDVERLFCVQAERASRAQEYSSNNTRERLAVREEVQELRAAKLKRGYENGSR